MQRVQRIVTQAFVQTQARREKMSREERYDVVIVGGGPMAPPPRLTCPSAG